MSLITPHGGKLVNRVLEADAAKSPYRAVAGSYKSVMLSPREQFDLEMIAIGAFSPLTGFMGRADFTAVCKECGWPTARSGRSLSRLCPPDDVAATINEGEKLAL